MPKRIILLGPLPPPYGGVSVFLSTRFTLLKDQHIHLWTFFGKDSDNPRITRFYPRRLGIVGQLARRGYKARIVDFTHFHLEHPNPILLPIWLASKSLIRFEWIKYILDGSLPARYPNFSPVKRQLFLQAINAIDEFIVVSEELGDWLSNDIKVKQRVTVIPCLLNIPGETLRAGVSPTTRATLKGLRDHEKLICSIGTFIDSYGFAHVAQAVERLREETKQDLGLLLLDGSFAEEPGYRDKVLAGRDWITVLKNVENPDVYQFLQRSDLFVRAFGGESYGISRVEALWCGVPVIATDVGETRGMLTYKFRDIDRLVNLIRETLGDKNRNGAQDWAQHFRREAEGNLEKFITTVGL